MSCATDAAANCQFSTENSGEGIKPINTTLERRVKCVHSLIALLVPLDLFHCARGPRRSPRRYLMNENFSAALGSLDRLVWQRDHRGRRRQTSGVRVRPSRQRAVDSRRCRRRTLERRWTPPPPDAMPLALRLPLCAAAAAVTAAAAHPASATSPRSICLSHQAIASTWKRREREKDKSCLSPLAGTAAREIESLLEYSLKAICNSPGGRGPGVFLSIS